MQKASGISSATCSARGILHLAPASSVSSVCAVPVLTSAPRSTTGEMTVVEGVPRPLSSLCPGTSHWSLPLTLRPRPQPRGQLPYANWKTYPYNRWGSKWVAKYQMSAGPWGKAASTSAPHSGTSGEGGGERLPWRSEHPFTLQEP